MAYREPPPEGEWERIEVFPAYPRKRSKYRAVPTVVDGIRFDSKLEARRYGELKLLEKAGAITKIQIHRRFPLFAYSARAGGEVLVGHYEADFDYWTEGGKVIEDCKGVRTDLYRWKKKHFEAQYGMKITEIPAKSRKSGRAGAGE